MSKLDDFLDEACDELDLSPDDVDQGLVLDLARDVAHGVARPAAPLSTYLLGLAVGRGADPAAAAAALTDIATAYTDPRP